MYERCALVAKSVDAQDLKSCGEYHRAGSSPARGTIGELHVAE